MGILWRLIFPHNSSSVNSLHCEICMSIILIYNILSKGYSKGMLIFEISVWMNLTWLGLGLFWSLFGLVVCVFLFSVIKQLKQKQTCSVLNLDVDDYLAFASMRKSCVCWTKRSPADKAWPVFTLLDVVVVNLKLCSVRRVSVFSWDGAMRVNPSSELQQVRTGSRPATLLDLLQIGLASVSAPVEFIVKY